MAESTVAQALTVFIIVRSALERHALRQLFDGARELAVVGDAGNFEEALSDVERLRPHIVLLEVDMQNQDSPWRVSRITSASPDSRVILLADDQGGDALLHAAGLGIWGYISKDFALQQLMRAAQLVGQGLIVVGCTTTRDVLRRLATLSRAPAQPSVRLSLKETEIIRAMASGATDRQIAHALVIAVPTVKTYVRSILKKTRTRNRAEAVAHSLRNGLIT